MLKKINRYFLPFIFLLVFISEIPLIIVRPVTYYSPRNTVSSILSAAFATAGFLALVILFIGAVMVYSAHGKPVKINKGKHLISFAVFSLVIILFLIFMFRSFGL